mmetsp:Transcript_6004/g.14568  ORF Transcript_6004/g.14568 Transcript_6004/m.14568 type:complete len:249 (-) Transcript_6004:253-999(-)
MTSRPRRQRGRRTLGPLGASRGMGARAASGPAGCVEGQRARRPRLGSLASADRTAGCYVPDQIQARRRPRPRPCPRPRSRQRRGKKSHRSPNRTSNLPRRTAASWTWTLRGTPIRGRVRYDTLCRGRYRGQCAEILWICRRVTCRPDLGAVGVLEVQATRGRMRWGRMRRGRMQVPVRPRSLTTTSRPWRWSWHLAWVARSSSRPSTPRMALCSTVPARGTRPPTLARSASPIPTPPSPPPLRRRGIR